MPIDATPGGPNANSYGTQAEANAYFTDRLPLAPPWPATDQSAVLIMATRVLESFAQRRRRLVDGGGNGLKYPHYIVSRYWTGSVATDTQALAWPRNGMVDGLGRAIANTVVPQKLKEAQFELAGQLLAGDRTLDNDVSVQGITSVRAGSVAVTFKDMIARQVLPDAVMELLVPSWLTDEVIEPMMRPMFGAV